MQVPFSQSHARSSVHAQQPCRYQPTLSSVRPIDSAFNAKVTSQLLLPANMGSNILSESSSEIAEALMKRNLERGPVQVKERVVRDPSIRTGLDNSMEQCDIAAQLQRGNGLVGTFAAQDTPRGPRLQKLFNLMDSNKDGHIDEMEWPSGAFCLVGTRSLAWNFGNNYFLSLTSTKIGRSSCTSTCSTAEASPREEMHVRLLKNWNSPSIALKLQRLENHCNGVKCSRTLHQRC